METPRLVLVTCLSRSLDDLAPALGQLRQALALLRARRCMKEVGGGVGAIEPRLADNEKRWTVHAHIALDGTWNDQEVACAWRSLTNGRGRFSRDKRAGILAPRQLAAYVTKADSWCPRPGALSIPNLGELRSAIRGRRVVIAWGTGLAARNVAIHPAQDGPDTSSIT